MLLIVTRGKPNNVNNLGRLYETLREREIPYKVASTLDANIIKCKDIRGIIIPGSRGIGIKPTEPQPELELELYYLHHLPNIPVLGICHGCQFLMTYYGGELIQYNSYWIGSKDIELDLSQDQIFHGEERRQKIPVYFHDLPVITPEAAKAGVREIAWLTRFRDGRRHACAFEFEKGRVYGFMFHSESKKDTRTILYNFYDRVCSASSASSA
jgi:GMP synthase-like glutamine amidotransferase